LLGVVPDGEEIVTSTNIGEPIVYNNKSVAGEAFKRISKRLEGEKIPFLDLDTKKGFLSALKRLFK
jgi:septum site-determining protein MinD